MFQAESQRHANRGWAYEAVQLSNPYLFYEHRSHHREPDKLLTVHIVISKLLYFCAFTREIDFLPYNKIDSYTSYGSFALIMSFDFGLSAFYLNQLTKPHRVFV
jgi:hypothetical protein